MKTKKRIIVYLLSMAIAACGLFLFSGCDELSNVTCTHQWRAATCTEPKICSLCGLMDGAPTGHLGGYATCSKQAICVSCGMEYGSFAAHTWVDATCTEAKYCITCSATQGMPLGHSGERISCTSKTPCTVCGTEFGEISNHVWVNATCTEPKHCENCTVTDGAPLPHVGGTATCSKQAICEVCENEYGATAPHTWVNATCTEAKYCSVCDFSDGDALGHSGGVATCTTQALCTVCGDAYGEFNGVNHTGTEAWFKRTETHYRGYSCCGLSISQAEEHTFENDVCTVCGYDPVIRMENVTVRVEDGSATVAIEISDNPGVIGMELSVTYDESALKLTKASCGEAFGRLSFTAPNDLVSGCTFLWDTMELSGADIRQGEILVLTFDVNSGVTDGEYGILMKVKAYDNDLNALSFRLINGSIIVD